MYFDPDKFYRPDELDVIARPHTLSQWRYLGTGPTYVKAGARVIYHGKALNEWLESRTVESKVA